jgi:RNA polymerase sigma-70 factor, ECF subfamily
LTDHIDEHCNVISESPSTVMRARAGDAEAWQRVSAIYGPLVYNWARLKSISREDAFDLMQTVLMRVHVGFAGFRGPSFRGWLRAICNNEMALYYRRRDEPLQNSGGTTNLRIVANAPSPEAQEDSATTFEPELESILVQRALAIVRTEFAEKSVAAFLMSIEQSSSAAEIGRELELSAAAVRQAKYRILQRMRELLADQ